MMKRRGSTLLEVCMGLAIALTLFGLVLTLVARTASANVAGQKKLGAVRARLVARRLDERAQPASRMRPLIRRLYRSVAASE